MKSMNHHVVLIDAMLNNLLNILHLKLRVNNKYLDSWIIE